MAVGMFSKLGNLWNNQPLEVKQLLAEIKILKENLERTRTDGEKFRTLVELAPDAFFQGDSKGNFIVVNDKTIELTGYTREELLRMNMADLFPKEILKEKPLRYDLLKVGQTIKIEREIVTKTGEHLFVEMASKAMPDGTYQSLMRNITKRKMAENAILRSELRLTRAELAVNSGNWELHLDTQRIVGSQGAIKLYGVSEEEFNYEYIKKIPLPEYRDMMDQAVKELIIEDKPYDIEFKIKAVDTGEIKDIHSIAFFDKEKRIIFGIIQDITEHKNTEAKLLEALEKAKESDRLKTVFLQNMSHEIRTPMNAIVGFSDLLPEYFDDIQKLTEFTDIIKQRSADLLKLINEILDLSIIETGKIPVNNEPVDVKEIFEELFVFFDNHRNKIQKSHIDLQIYSECVSTPLIVNTDKGKLKQIFINLIYNAFKFTNSGSIVFGCRIVEETPAFFVSDTGCGISEDMQDLIFDRFIQVNSGSNNIYSGTGLGLSIVKGLIEVLEGIIWLESKPDEGATFYFTVRDLV